MVLHFGKDVKLAELISRMQKAKPTTILFSGSARDIRDLPQDVRKATLLFGGEDGTWSAADGDWPVPVYAATAFVVDKTIPRTAVFADKFRAAYKVEPTVHSALTYDAIGLLVEAVRQAPSEKPEAIRDELARLQKFPGLTGPLSLSSEGHCQRPAFVVRLEGKTAALSQKYDP